MLSEQFCESQFETMNTLDGQHMVKYDSEELDPAKKIDARKNEHTISSNIQKLVRIFRKPEKEALLRKEFKDQTKINDQNAFQVQFKKMMELWMTKLCTSLEEANRMHEQLQISTKRVTELEDQKSKKQTELDQF